jgi:thioredoxin-like negative regulator of GroEL
MHRRRLIARSAAVAALLMALPTSLRAAAVADFTPQSFAQAQQEGRPILVHINAGWCPTCARQRPILQTLEAAPEFKELLVFRVDFDTQKDVVRQFAANMQSTLIAFHGARETARSVGETNPDAISALVHSTLR